jgi:peptide/nickel transport system permease protein
MLSAMIYGLRTSLLVGLSAVLLSATVGIALGLVSGYFGGSSAPSSCALPTCS